MDCTVPGSLDYCRCQLSKPAENNNNNVNRLIRKTLVRTVTAAAPAAAAAATDYQHHPGFCLTSLFSTDYSKLGQVPRRSSKNSGMTGVRFLQDRCHSCHPTVSKRNKERKKKGMKKGRKERNKERIERDRKKVNLCNTQGYNRTITSCAGGHPNMFRP